MRFLADAVNALGCHYVTVIAAMRQPSSACDANEIYVRESNTGADLNAISNELLQENGRATGHITLEKMKCDSYQLSY